MTLNQKVGEAGWFYHAPHKREVCPEPTLYPPMSQIPGLNDEEGLGPDTDAPRPLFKDTDTDYVRLAKQGGRQNLLRFRDPPSKKREAVGYPRNEWFYLEDNALEDQAKKEPEEPYHFRLPEYMVNEGYKPDGDNANYERPRRAPFAFDRLSAYEREGGSLTDKTVKLPELTRPGYGIRSGKPLKKMPQHPMPERARKPVSAAQSDPGTQHKQGLKYLPLPEEGTKNKATIQKILSYAYDREWHDNISNWQKKQDRVREKHAAMTTEPKDLSDKRVSEYRETYGKSVGNMYPHKKHDAMSVISKPVDHHSQVKGTTSTRLREARFHKEEEKEPFKLARFKNIAARVESHRPHEVTAAH